MADDIPLVFRDGDSWVCIADPYQFPQCYAGFGDTEEEAVREYRRDMGLSDDEIALPVVEGKHFVYRNPCEV